MMVTITCSKPTEESVFIKSAELWLPELESQKAVEVFKPLQDCPGGTCIAPQTCCSASGGYWGCCPYPSAVCCQDLLHCCPQSYSCNLTNGQCTIPYPYGLMAVKPLGVISLIEDEDNE